MKTKKEIQKLLIVHGLADILYDCENANTIQYNSILLKNIALLKYVGILSNDDIDELVDGGIDDYALDSAYRNAVIFGDAEAVKCLLFHGADFIVDYGRVLRWSGSVSQSLAEYYHSKSPIRALNHRLLDILKGYDIDPADINIGYLEQLVEKLILLFCRKENKAKSFDIILY